MIRLAVGCLLIGAVLVGCSEESPPIEAAEPTSMDTVSPTTTARPSSKYAKDCIDANRAAAKQFDTLFHQFDPSNTSRAEAMQLLDQMRQIMVVLKVDGEDMVAQILHLGPVSRGDECLYGSAVTLDVMKNLFPLGSEDHAYAAEAAQTYYEAILRHYPESSFAREAEAALESQ